MIATLVVLGVLATGCGGGADTSPVATPLANAPGPAESPAPAASPAGTVVPLGGNPEGVALTADSTVAVNVHGPNGLVLFPLAHPGQRRTVSLSGSARHLLLAGPSGPLIVPQESADRVVEVDPVSGATVASIPAGRVPHDAIAVGKGRIFAADEAAATVQVIVGTQVTRVVPAPLAPGGMAASPDGSVVVVVGVRGRRITAYRADGTATGSANCGAGPTHAVTGSSGIDWVVDTLGGAVLGFRVEGGTPRQVARIPVGDRPYGAAYDSRRSILWVTLTGTNRLVGLHVSGSSVQRTISLPTVRQPDTVAVDDATGTVVVTGSGTDGSLQIVRNAATAT